MEKIFIEEGDLNVTHNATDSHENAEHGEHMPGEALIALFVFVGLLIGCVFREINKKLKIPYTPAILGIGIILGISVDSLGVVGQATELMSEINPHGILMVFIPTLIFESGMNIEWFVFKKAFVNILILAGPGVLYGAILLAGGLKWIIGYTDDELSWAGALTLGSIISTTDPVAVVALLKQLGAPVPLNTLIEGESLLNDGVAMVFFSLFASMAKGEATSPLTVIWNFITLAGGGALLGIVTGVLGTLWLRRVLRDSVLGITLTFIMCYLAFFVAEFMGYKISGILAIVSLGLFMSAFGKTTVDPEGEHSLHAVWAWVQYACETLIFLLTGCLIGLFIIHRPPGTITTTDWSDMLIFYIIMMAARMIMIVTFMPILSKNGYGLTWKESLVTCYGGLRGALGLALALMVAVDDGFNIRMRELVLFHMAGMATITLLLNGTTCSALVRYLGIVQESEVRDKIKKNLMAELLVESGTRLEEIKKYKYLNLANWEKVRKLAGIDDMLAKVQKTPQGKVDVRNEAAYKAFKDEDIYAESRYRLLRIMKGLVWEKFEENQITGPATRLLNEAVEISLEANNKPIAIWEFLYSAFVSNKTTALYLKVKDWIIIGPLAKKYVANHLSFLYQVVTTFIIIAEEVIEHHEDIPLSKEHIKVVVEELEKNRIDANNYIISIQDQFAELIINVQIKRAAYNILFFQRQKLDQNLKEGQIEEKEYNDLRRDIDRRIVSLEESLSFEDWNAPTFDDFVMQFPIFSSLRREEIDLIKGNAQIRIFSNGEPLYTRGAKVGGIFVVTKGIVRQYFDLEKNSTKHGLGSILSFSNIVSEGNVALGNCVALGEVQTQFISASVLQDVMRRNPEFEAMCYKNSLYQFVKSDPQTAGDLARLDEQNTLNFATTARLVKIEKGIKFQIASGGYLFSGDMKKLNTGLRINRPCFIYPSSDEYSSDGNTVYLAFQEDISIYDTKRSSLHAQKVSYQLPPKESVRRESYRAGFEGPRKSKRSILEDLDREQEVTRNFQNMYKSGPKYGEKTVRTNKNQDDFMA